MANRQNGTDDTSAVELARLRCEVDQSTHDLANALGAVLNYAGFLAEDLEKMADDTDAKIYLPHLESATRRALDLVGRLGAAARTS